MCCSIGSKVVLSVHNIAPHGRALCGPHPGGPVHVCVPFDILLTAHGSFCYLLVGFLQLLRLVHHAASSGAMHALACVHTQCLQILS